MKEPRGNRLIAHASLALAGAVALLGCGPGRGESLPVLVDSKTNWLMTCETDLACGQGLNCLCGVCTKNCDNTACAANSTCVDASEAAAQVTCSSQAVRALCLPSCENAACGPDETCVLGVCALDRQKSQEVACAAESSEAMSVEYGVLESLFEARTAGLLPCAQGEAKNAGFRLDASLRCRAREYSKNMVEQGFYSVDSPNGTTAEDLVRQAGFPSGAWGVTISQADSGAQLLQEIAADDVDPDKADVNCWAISHGEYTDVGIGYVGGLLTILYATRESP